MANGSAQNGSACAVGAVDDIRPEFTLWGSFAQATWRMAFAPYTPALALLPDTHMVALRGHCWPGYILLFLLLVVRM